MSPTLCDDGFLIPGCMLLVGMSVFCYCNVSDKVLLSASAGASMTCFSDGVTAVEEALER